MKFVSAIFPVVALLIGNQLGFAQGFVNMDFESANLAGYSPRSQSVPVADALPGWTCYLGSNQTDSVWYDNVALDSAAVGIVDSSFPYIPVGLFSGDYCVSLQYGVSGYSTYGTASIAQKGQISPYAKSILFNATYPFQVTFSGNIIPLVVLSTQTGYNLYGGDVSQFAGQTGLLTITSYTHFAYLDQIRFSSSSVPEPSELALTALGALLLGFRRLRHR